MRNKLLTSTGPLATTRTGVKAPLPLIDLEKILTIIADTYDYSPSVDDEKQFNDSNLAEPLEAFAQLLRKHHKQRARVLAISCGAGWEANFLMARGFDLVGIDTSAEMIRRARNRASSGKFSRLRMQNLQFPPEETFDAIWSTRTLIHVPQALVVDLLASWKRVLKPGGILCLGVNLGERNGWEIDEAMPGPPAFYHYFAEDELEKALEAAGYQVVDKAHFTGKSNSAESRNFLSSHKNLTRAWTRLLIHNMCSMMNMKNEEQYNPKTWSQPLLYFYAPVPSHLENKRIFACRTIS